MWPLTPCLPGNDRFCPFLTRASWTHRQVPHWGRAAASGPAALTPAPASPSTVTLGPRSPSALTPALWMGVCGIVFPRRTEEFNVQLGLRTAGLEAGASESPRAEPLPGPRGWCAFRGCPQRGLGKPDSGRVCLGSVSSHQSQRCGPGPDARVSASGAARSSSGPRQQGEGGGRCTLCAPGSFLCESPSACFHVYLKY